jgi:RNA polymerase sigma-70 factor (ECF subfamily)
MMPTLQDAEDIVATTFLKAWETRMEGVEDEKAWLFRTAKNNCINAFRSGKFKYMRMWEEKFEDYLQQDDRRMIEAAQIKALYMERLRNAMSELPPQCRQVCELAYLKGLKNSEIAKVLNIKSRTVTNQKLIALTKLKGKLLFLLIAAIFCKN